MRRGFGSVGRPSLQEQHRASADCPAVEAILQDLRFAFRLIARDRWFSAVVIVTLALGIGANTTGFSIVNAASSSADCRSTKADRLYMLSLAERVWAAARRRLIPELEDWRAARAARFAEPRGLSQRDDERQRRSRGCRKRRGARGSPTNAFGVLRQPPLSRPRFHRRRRPPRGGARRDHRLRALEAAATAQIPQVLGRTLRVNGEPATIVGVMPGGHEVSARPATSGGRSCRPTPRCAEPSWPLRLSAGSSDGTSPRERTAE